MTNIIKRFARDEDGATAIEYGLIAALIAVAIIASITALGDGLSEQFTAVNECLDGTKPGPDDADGNPTTVSC